MNATADHLSPGMRLLCAACLALANFVVVLDLTIANVSVPHIASNLGATLEQGTWTITSYAVAEAICVPLAGWLSQRYGAVRLFFASLVGFGVFSFLCGMSSTLGMLVAFRIAQGLCGAPIMPMSQTLLLMIYPMEKRGNAMAAWATTVMLAPALGPIVGGYISDEFSWHWIFLVNVPVVTLLLAGTLVTLRGVETSRQRLPIDVVGLALLVFWIGCLQLMLDIGRDRGWFEDGWIVVLGVGTALGFVVFVIWELTEEHPIVDLRVFRHTRFTMGVFSFAIGFGAFFAGIVVTPQWLQTSLGYSATQAGTVTSMHAYAAICMAPFVPRLMRRVDPRYLVAIGVGWMGLAGLLRAGWTSETDYWTIALAMGLQGFGIPMLTIPLTTVTLTAVEPGETANAAGMQSFARTIAVAIATATSLTVWSDAQRISRNGIVDTLRPDAATRALGDAGMPYERVQRVVESMVDKEAVILALNHTYFVTASFLFAAAALILLSPKPRSVTALPAGH